jgi:hypothetical protein
MRTPGTRHAREGGHPVRREAAVDCERFGILRTMTAELENPDVAANGDI